MNDGSSENDGYQYSEDGDSAMEGHFQRYIMYTFLTVKTGTNSTDGLSTTELGATDHSMVTMLRTFHGTPALILSILPLAFRAGEVFTALR